MLALVFDGETAAVRDRPPPDRQAGESLIAMRRAGICDTDVQLARGYMDYRGGLGHEFVGEVIESDDHTLIGARVVADINAGCGECRECRDANGHHCAARTVLGILGRDGALASQLVMPDRCLVRVPGSISDDRAVFAEPLAAALHVLDSLTGSDRRAIVVGDGKLGLLVATALVASGIETTAVGHHRDKLALTPAAAILEAELPGNLAAPVVVEATGTAGGLTRAMALCAPRGKLILKSTIAGSHTVDLSPVVINELSVIGSRCGDLAEAIEWLAAGRIDPCPLIAARYPLAEADRALEHATHPGALKVLVEA